MREAINILGADLGRIVDTKSNLQTLRLGCLASSPVLDNLARYRREEREEMGPGKFLIRQLGRDR